METSPWVSLSGEHAFCDQFKQLLKSWPPHMKGRQKTAMKWASDDTCHATRSIFQRTPTIMLWIDKRKMLKSGPVIGVAVPCSRSIDTLLMTCCWEFSGDHPPFWLVRPAHVFLFFVNWKMPTSDNDWSLVHGLRKLVQWEAERCSLVVTSHTCQCTFGRSWWHMEVSAFFFEDNIEFLFSKREVTYYVFVCRFLWYCNH